MSLSSVAVQLAHKILGDLEGRSVLLLGAGEMAQLAARELKSSGARELLVANRSSEKAEQLAREVAGVPVGLAELPLLLERADVVICSTGAQEAIVTHELMAGAARARRFRPIFLIDLALPRNVEPKVNQLENVYVYDLDDLERVAAQNRDLRESELLRAEEIVDGELRALLLDLRERASVPVLAQLRAHAQALAEAEAARTLSQLGPVSERHQKSVRAMAAAIVNKLLHAPTQALRSEAVASTAVVTPYLKPVNDGLRAYLESSGVKVETLDSFFCKTTAELGRITEDQVLELALRTVTPQSKSLFVACSQLPTLNVVANQLL